MAFKNFLIPGSYTRIDSMTFSKQAFFASCALRTYKDESCKEILLDTSVNLSTNTDPISYSKTIKTEEELFDEAPEYLSLLEKDFWFISIPEANSDYAKDINNKIIGKNIQGQIAVFQPTFIFDKTTGKTSKFNSELLKYEELSANKIETKNQFLDLFFNSGLDVTAAMYAYVKTLPAYQNLQDV